MRFYVACVKADATKNEPIHSCVLSSEEVGERARVAPGVGRPRYRFSDKGGQNVKKK